MPFLLTKQEQLKSLRGSSGTERNLRPRNDCTLLIVETQYEVSFDKEGNAVDESAISRSDVVRCALSEDDTKIVGKYFMSVKGLDKEQLNYIQSGETTLNTAATYSEGGDLYLPAGAGLELFGTIPEDRRRLAVTTGTKKVLVVSANAKDVSTTANIAQLADDIFGVAGDPTNLNSQYLQCSHGQLNFQPAEKDGTIKNGVIEVNVDIKASGAFRFDLEEAVELAAAKVVGNLRQFDHVMLCLPPGSLSGGSDW